MTSWNILAKVHTKSETVPIIGLKCKKTFLTLKNYLKYDAWSQKWCEWYSILDGKPDIERPADSTLKLIFREHKVSLPEKVFLYRKSNVFGNMFFSFAFRLWLFTVNTILQVFELTHHPSLKMIFRKKKAEWRWLSSNIGGYCTNNEFFRSN